MGNSQALFAIVLFVVIYGIVISEKINRTVIAIFGAALFVVLKLVEEHMVLEHIDFNTIGLLIGMMCIVGITKRTGIFEYLAIRSAKAAKGEPWRIIVLFSIITAVSSALLDNVTTMLLIAPVTLVITDALDVDPVPFILIEILFANIGGAATLIGDPPNIMIGSANDIGFLSFLVNLGPVIIVIATITMFILKFMFAKKLHVTEEHRLKVLNLNEKIAIHDHALLKKCLFVLGLTVAGFLLHETLHFQSATIALFNASLLLLISKVDPEEVFFDIEWSTIFFFMALFILVGGLEEAGVIGNLANKLLTFTQGNLVMTVLLVLWVSAIASAFLDNIPFVATMIPLIKNIETMSTMPIMPVWWALALGACLGGNGTMIGASANVIGVGMLEKHGVKLSFFKYMKVAFPLMLVSIVIATGYLMLFYV